MKAIKITILLNQPMNPFAEDILRAVIHDALRGYTTYSEGNVKVEETDVVASGIRLEETKVLG